MSTSPSARITWVHHAARLLLGGVLLLAGTGHLTTLRQDFQAQVPTWLPLDPDFVVVASGVVELALGAALTVLPRQRLPLGAVVAAFFVAVFPGNISQYLTRTDAFGLNTDQSRLIRLCFQPLLVAWALWSTGAWAAWRASRRGRPASE
ncbi:DoxX family membrane protein [Deinococcus sp. Arct2-2]|uniref:DoxX family protein n=1 Tax=Deinococcus sp. Arct2-2 TaxID=2568653 RepID=UPI0010A4F02E|nr:DoxX family membrane protein [Deinococcus sp. Arct2-2]THF69194.1 DoxX family membrane protein [Deinococcus sp. Arct2-2]